MQSFQVSNAMQSVENTTKLIGKKHRPAPLLDVDTVSVAKNEAELDSALFVVDSKGLKLVEVKAENGIVVPWSTIPLATALIATPSNVCVGPPISRVMEPSKIPGPVTPGSCNTVKIEDPSVKIAPDSAVNPVVPARCWPIVRVLLPILTTLDSTSTIWVSTTVEVAPWDIVIPLTMTSLCPFRDTVYAWPSTIALVASCVSTPSTECVGTSEPCV